MNDLDAYKISVREFIRRGKFPDVIITRAEALHHGCKVYRTGKRCDVCGLKTWQATINWACLNCKTLKLGRWKRETKRIQSAGLQLMDKTAYDYLLAHDKARGIR